MSGEGRAAHPHPPCARCQAPLAADARFCGSCGHSVSPTEQSPTGAAGEPRHPARDLIGAEIGGRYRIVAKLGEGGMGAVFRAEQISLKRTVALKLLKPELSAEPGLVRRFNAEAELAAKLNHPNTVTLFDFGQEPDGTLFIVMEFIEGVALRQLLIQGGPLPAARALAIAAQVAASLADAHAHGIVHRDLKPDNVMLSERGRERDVVRVLDFGIAKLRDERGDVTQMAMTQAGDLLGTPQYMAPEQIRAERVDGRTDVYALGAMLYEMVTGRLPFEAPTLMAILGKHLTELPVPPAQRRPDLGIPAELDQLIMHALQKAPADRPPSMEQVGERLGHLRAALGPAGYGAAPGHATPAPASAAAVRRPPGVPITRPPAMTPAPAQPGYVPAGPVGTPAPLYPEPSAAYAPAPAPAPMPATAGGSRTWLWALLAVLIVGGGGAGAYFLARGGAEATSGGGADPGATGAEDWDITPKREVFGGEVDGYRGNPLAAPAGRWRHPSLGFELQLPPGFAAQPGAAPGQAAFSGSIGQEPAFIVVSGEPFDTSTLTPEAMQLVAQSLAEAGGGRLLEQGWAEVGGVSRFGGTYEGEGLRYQFVVYPDPHGHFVAIAMFGTAVSAFADSATARRDFFASFALP